MFDHNYIAHISNNYISSKVHSKLISAVGHQFQDVAQFVYVPVRRRADIGLNKVSADRISFKFDYCLPPFLKYLPLLKVIWVAYRFYKSVPKFKPRVIVAHSLWSDGVPAFIFSMLSGASYSLFVRGTDLNFFIPKLPHYRLLIWLVIKYADNVYFVSPGHKREFEKRYQFIYSAMRKVVVLPNGVDQYWLENTSFGENVRDGLLFVGRFDRNKNLGVVLKVFEKLLESDPGLQLNLVGGTKSQLISLLDIKDVPDGVNVLGLVPNREYLCDLYRSASVLIVPSKSETFGLVYIEALTQGCPVVHSSGQGISGYFDGCGFVTSAGSDDVDGLFSCVKRLEESYSRGVRRVEIVGRLVEFSWENIARVFIHSLNAESE